MSLVAFGILRAAMFAEPAVTQIEEVRGLMHLEISDDKSQISNQPTETSHLKLISNLKFQI